MICCCAPATIVAPFPVENRYVAECAGKKFDNYVEWLGIVYAITLVCCPALSLPCGFTASGLPVGLQMVAPPRGEAQLLAGAKVLEDILGVRGTTPIDPRAPKLKTSDIRGNMTDDHEPPPESKLTRSKERWAREGKFLTGKISRPEEARLPPGQHLTKDWPMLDLGLTPNISRERWRLDVYGAVENPIFWDFCAIHRAAAEQIRLRHPLRHHLVALRQSMGGLGDPRPARCLPAARRGAFRGAAFP